jgi:hypothetical protein
MAKRDRRQTAKTIEKRRKLGRGIGRGAEYKPYLYIHDASTQGLASRVRGWTTGREHHLTTKLELHCFYTMDWAPSITDIREQYPLDLDETRAIARRLDIRHPADPRTGDDHVMITDFVLTTSRGTVTADSARAVRYAASLARARVLEKLEIERVYWSGRGVDWGIITEREINRTLVINVEWVHRYRDVRDLPPLDEALVRRVEATLSPLVGAKAALNELTDSCDDRLGLAPGTSLTVVRHLIASRRWRVDMNEPINPSERLLLAATVPDSAAPLAVAGGVR